jgi:hypothetical protein
MHAAADSGCNEIVHEKCELLNYGRVLVAPEAVALWRRSGVAAPLRLPDAGRLGSNLLQAGLWPISQANALELMVDIFELAMPRLPRLR